MDGPLPVLARFNGLVRACAIGVHGSLYRPASFVTEFGELKVHDLC